jgi:hypothetical protein
VQVICQPVSGTWVKEVSQFAKKAKKYEAVLSANG